MTSEKALRCFCSFFCHEAISQERRTVHLLCFKVTGALSLHVFMLPTVYVHLGAPRPWIFRDGFLKIVFCLIIM